MSKLLINEPPLQVLPSLAKLIGLSEAIVLQQLHYESRKSKDDGWVQRSIVDWHRDDFFFLGRRTIERAFTGLRDRGLIVTDVVPSRDGREVRMRVNMEALEALEIPARGSRQIGGTSSRQSGGTPTAKLAGPHTLKGEPERTEVISQGEITSDENPPSPPEGGRGEPDPVAQVFEAWLESTNRTDRTVLDGPRRRVIEKALESHGLQDCVDAVRGWKHSTHHRGENDRQTIFNDIKLLLRDAGRIEFFRDLERQHGDRVHRVGGVDYGGRPRDRKLPGIVERCPDHTDGLLLQEWSRIREELVAAVSDQPTFEIWFAEAHPHRVDGDALILAAPVELAGWIGERYGELLVSIAGRPVRVVGCSSAAGAAGRAVA